MIRKIVEALFPGTVKSIRSEASKERDDLWGELTGIDLYAVLADKEHQAELARAKAQAKGKLTDVSPMGPG